MKKNLIFTLILVHEKIVIRVFYHFDWPGNNNVICANYTTENYE